MHISHEHFCCNRRYDAAIILTAGFLWPGGQARPSRPQRIVPNMLQSLGAPRARLAWCLVGFVTNRHEIVRASRMQKKAASGVEVKVEVKGTNSLHSAKP